MMFFHVLSPLLSIVYKPFTNYSDNCLLETQVNNEILIVSDLDHSLPSLSFDDLTYKITKYEKRINHLEFKN